MEKQELRIGNLVMFYKSMVHEPLIGTVTSIDNYEGEYKVWIPEFSQDIMLPITALKSIKLTEDWLLKFGFTSKWSDGKSRKEYDFKGLYFYHYKTPKTESVQYESGQDVIKIKTVHQLQNLIYALKNIELTLIPTLNP
jgi:hypothetical protein